MFPEFVENRGEDLFLEINVFKAISDDEFVTVASIIIENDI